MHDKTDLDLINEANIGNTQAMETLYFRYRDWSMRVAFTFCQNESDCQDILQETFKVFFSKFPGFKLSCKLKTYLYTIIRSRAIDHVRKKQRLVSTDEPLAEESQGISLSEDPETIRERISEMVSQLPLEQQDVMILRFADGYSLQEIADTLKVPQGTVKSRLHNGLSSLKKLFLIISLCLMNLLELLFV